MSDCIFENLFTKIRDLQKGTNEVLVCAFFYYRTIENNVSNRAEV